MELGFETIGNATLICHDRGPQLVTDPWIAGGAYFGSWGLSHEVPPEQREAIAGANWVWISHGHPDHLSAESLAGFRDKTILLPDAVGGRIRDDLRREGFHVEVLPDRTWVRLSSRISVLCIADCNQDGILLVDLDGRLVVDLNDADDCGWGRQVRREIAGRRVAFLLRLSGFGDADMINLHDEEGHRLEVIRRFEVGRENASLVKQFGARYFVPFSSMHRYRRADSVWANRYVTKLADYPVGFDARGAECLPAFIRYDCLRDRVEPIAPRELPDEARDPAELGDHWDEPLEADEVARARRYFGAVEHLGGAFDFIDLRVGGCTHRMVEGRMRTGRGLTFEAPRGSLMAAIDGEVFDDLLIGNFMKTTLHGAARRTGLYPDFSPYVAKYGDNGRARTDEALRDYFARYRARAPFDFLRYRLEKQAKDRFRALVDRESPAFGLIRRAYYRLKEGLA